MTNIKVTLKALLELEREVRKEELDRISLELKLVELALGSDDPRVHNAVLRTLDNEK